MNRTILPIPNKSLHGTILRQVEQEVLKQLSQQKSNNKLDHLTQYEILQALFVNFRMVEQIPYGLRLTSFGNKVLSKIYDQYEYEISDEINHKTFVLLDKSMKWPYYIGTRSNRVVFYSEEDAAWFRLNGNKILSYVESI